MKVLLVLGSSTGGIGAHVRDLAGFLVREGHRVVVAGPAATEEQFGFSRIGSAAGGAAPYSGSRGKASACLTSGAAGSYVSGSAVSGSSDLSCSLASPASSGSSSTSSTSGPSDSGSPASPASGTFVRFIPVAIGPTPDPANDLAAVRTLRRLARDADAVHAHGVRAGSLTRLALPHSPGSPRSVVTLHNAMLATGSKARLLGMLERMAVRRADIVLGASADLVARARELGARRAELGPVPAPPLRPPTRSRPQVRAELGLDRNRPLLLAVGRLAPQKAYPVLLDAMARLGTTTKPTLLIAGDGPLQAELQAKIDRLGLDARLLGRRDDVAELLAAADIFVLCSDWEARALVVQEAMRAGLPVLATNVGGIPELVGDAAVLVPPGEPEAFARALSSILGDAEEQGRLRRAALAQAATWPSAEAALALVLASYSR
jgi:glycosyltransferase involved in cell wall biosynthesis